MSQEDLTDIMPHRDLADFNYHVGSIVYSIGDNLVWAVLYKCTPDTVGLGLAVLSGTVQYDAAM